MPAHRGTKHLVAAEKITVDINILKSLVGNDQVIIKEFLQDFLRDARKIAEQLQSTVADGKADEAKFAVHKLKSSARSIGALALGEWCAQMEVAAKEGDVEKLARLLPGFKQELAEVGSYIKKVLAQPDV
ncbi:Hpt domain-containing protein [Nitrosomonas sp. GH22]|nr:Hpt domain-containing protein [Nitrosomonas sp. GH22]